MSSGAPDRSKFTITQFTRTIQFMNQKETYYRYVFDNKFAATMTPVEAHKYAYHHKCKILEGVGYQGGRRKKKFDGWGWHDGLLRTFRGPKDYRDFLRANNMYEAGGSEGPLQEENFDKPLWDEALIKKATDMGIEIGSVLAEALLKGELDFPDGTTCMEDLYDDDEL